LETVNDEVHPGVHHSTMEPGYRDAKIAAWRAKAQPGLLMVDRTVHGPYEITRHLSNEIPAQQLDYPWESCMTLVMPGVMCSRTV